MLRKPAGCSGHKGNAVCFLQEPEPQAEPEPEQLLLALIKWAAKGAERLDRAAFSRVGALVFGGGGEGEEEQWQGLCEELGADASEGLGLAHLQALDDPDEERPGGALARWVAAHPRAAEYDALHAAATHPLNPQLVEAAEAGDVAAIERLAGEGASPDAKRGDGIPAVYMAAYKEHTAAVEALLRLGADPDAAEPDYGGTALMSAARDEHAEIVAALLRGGAVVDAVDGDGVTAFMGAARCTQAECARLLLEAGADASLRATGGYYEGKTALEAAEERAKKEKDPYESDEEFAANQKGFHEVAALLRG
eukprot:COSAG06_NODE_5975_length_3174_cov_8.128130_2_plen_309_part_00